MQRTGGFDNQAAIALKLTLPTVAKKHDDESSLQSTLLHKQHFSMAMCRRAPQQMRHDGPCPPAGGLCVGRASDGVGVKGRWEGAGGGGGRGEEEG